jgi:hypothetical protein
MKYPSRYSNGKMVSAAQYITEIICENKAKYNKQDLSFRFWTNKVWMKFYKDQIATANKLLQKYPEQAIIKALKNQKASNIYSLRAPHLIEIIEHEKTILENQNNTLNQEYDRSPKKFKTINNDNKKSKLTRLKELE